MHVQPENGNVGLFEGRMKAYGSASPLPAVGFIGLALIIVSANACIFDQGDYKRGGRLDTGSSASEGSSSSGKTSSSSSGNPLDNNPLQDAGGTVILDTGTQ